MRIWNSTINSQSKMGQKIARLDAKARKLILAIRGGRCERCGETEETAILDVHHIIGKRYWAVRWLPDNLVLLCRKHHIRAAQYIKAFRKWIEERRYKGLIDYLWKVARTEGPTDLDRVNDLLNRALRAVKQAA